MQPDLYKKVKLVYFPFLAISFFTIGLSTLACLFLNDDLSGVIVPFFIASLLILIFFRKRIHILKVAGKNEKGYAGYQYFALISIVMSAIFLTIYIELKQNSIVSVSSINKIDMRTPALYYKIATTKIDKTNYLYNDNSYTHKSTYTIKRDYYYPIETGVEARLNKFLYLISYQKDYHTRRYSEDNWKDFYEYVQRCYENELYLRPFYFKNVAYQKETNNASSQYNNSNTPAFILKPVFEPFEKTLTDSWRLFLYSFLISHLIYLLMVLIPSVNYRAYDSYKKGELLKNDWIYNILNYCIPKKPHFETSVLIIMMLLFYLLLVFFSHSVFPVEEIMYAVGTISNHQIISGEFWRLFVSSFMYINVFHLLLGCISIGMCGMLVERRIKFGSFLVTFLIAASCSAIVSIICLPDRPVYSSVGGICGLYGIVFISLLKKDYSFDDYILYLSALFITALLHFGTAFIIDGVNLLLLLSGFVVGIALALIKPSWYSSNTEPESTL